MNKWFEYAHSGAFVEGEPIGAKPLEAAGSATVCSWVTVLPSDETAA